jgi:hypothetical protein
MDPADIVDDIYTQAVKVVQCALLPFGCDPEFIEKPEDLYL